MSEPRDGRPRTRGAEQDGDSSQFCRDRRLHLGGGRGGISLCHVDRGLRDAGRHTELQIVFNGSVSGLSEGAYVLFNGLKVGEVTQLTLWRAIPVRSSPISTSTSDAPIDRTPRRSSRPQGITGAAAVALLGGSTPGNTVGDHGQRAIIYAEPSMHCRDSRQRRRALDQGQLGSRSRGEAPCRKFRHGPFDAVEYRPILEGARRQRPESTRR